MKNIYNISFSRLIASHLAHKIRNTTAISYLLMLVRPLEELHSIFLAYVNSVNTDVFSQICYMRAMLNDEFDYYERRIKIRTVKPDFNNILTWHIDTPKRIMVGARGSGNECLRNTRGQLGRNIPSFEIVFPIGYSLSKSEESRLRSLVNKNKLASKQYIIIYE